MHCSQLTKSTIAAGKKKKKEKNPVIKRRRGNNCNPNSHLTMLFESWKLVKKSFLNSVFKHLKIINVTQILLKKHSYQTFFFWGAQFSVFKH